MLQEYGICLVLQRCVTDLGAALRAAGGHPLPPPVVKAIMRSLLLGLQACHAAGFLHRDVAPHNLLFETSGALRLSEFGQARRWTAPLTAPAPATDEDASSTGQLSPGVGTRWYRAPELLFGARQYTPAVDMWSAGCVFAEMVTGQALFPGSSDIDQLCRIRDVLGSPAPEVWPGVEDLPDWGKLVFPPKEAAEWGEVVPGCAGVPGVLSLLRGLVRYDPAARLTPAQALQSEYFTSEPAAAGEDAVRAAIPGLQ